MSKRVRVRALEPLGMADNGLGYKVIPRGMTGTLKGMRPPTREDKRAGLLVLWDFEVIGNLAATEKGPGLGVLPGDKVMEVPLDSVEVIGIEEG